MLRMLRFETLVFVNSLFENLELLAKCASLTRWAEVLVFQFVKTLHELFDWLLTLRVVHFIMMSWVFSMLVCINILRRVLHILQLTSNTADCDSSRTVNFTWNIWYSKVWNGDFLLNRDAWKILFRHFVSNNYLILSFKHLLNLITDRDSLKSRLSLRKLYTSPCLSILNLF